jgi:hypothetical protein
MKGFASSTAAAITVLIVASGAAAATIVGTARNDSLRGTPKSDRLDGRAGNDRLSGLGGNDVLLGGAGNDALNGGAGADTFRCGPGADTVDAGAGDKIDGDCETVRGLPTISVADASVAEGTSGTSVLAFQVSLSRSAAHTVSVRYSTADGTASAPADYAPASGIVRFARGETSKSIEVTLTGDALPEPDETLAVRLSAPVNGIVGAASATGTIRNDEPRSGRYSGTTSQGRPVAFDVSPDLTSVTGLTFRLDLSCPAIDHTIADLEFAFGNSGLPLTAGGWTFGLSSAQDEPDFSARLLFAGSLAFPGSSSGTVRLDMTFATAIGPIACSSGTVSWSAQ